MEAAEDTPELRKARGAFFTPDIVCDFVAGWAIRHPSDRILEPSCGDAQFLTAAVRRMREWTDHPSVHGIEIHGDSAATARARIKASGGHGEIVEADFFSVAATPTYQAVIGNPPYVRYQGWTGANRSMSRIAALASGVPLTGLASSWASFAVVAAAHLAPEGRLGLVLPAELLTTNYAAEVRAWLLRTFASVRLVLFRELVFPDATEDVILLLAELPAAGQPAGCAALMVQEVATVSDLASLPDPTVSWTPPTTDGKWTGALLRDGDDFLGELSQNGKWTDLEAWGDVTLGMVTGANRFFCVTASEAENLPSKDVMAISPPGSAHLRTLTFTRAQWKALAAAGERVYLFRPEPDSKQDLDPESLRIVRRGERLKVHLGYKTGQRKVWWRTPLVARPDLLLTYMSDRAPQLSTNAAGVGYLNSVHGVHLAPTHRTLGRSLLPLAALNSASLFGAELVGRSYGGGLLKLEPKEADRWPMLSPAALAEHRTTLTALRRPVAARLAAGKLDEAVELVDQRLLIQGGILSPSQVRRAQAGRHELMERRRSRGR